MTYTPARTAVQARPADLCPRHRRPLEGGPIWFRCPDGHAIPAADLDHETHAPLRRVTL